MPEPLQPTREALELLARPWKPNILWHLRSGPLSFSQLRRRLGGVSRELLVQQLRFLERDGLIARRLLDEWLEYSLTPLAESLAPSLDRLYEWWHAHSHKIKQAQASYDQRTKLTPEPLPEPPEINLTH